MDNNPENKSKILACDSSQGSKKTFIYLELTESAARYLDEFVNRQPNSVEHYDTEATEKNDRENKPSPDSQERNKLEKQDSTHCTNSLKRKKKKKLKSKKSTEENLDDADTTNNKVTMQFENNEPVAVSIPSGNSIKTFSVNLVNNDLTESQGRFECLKESEEGTLESQGCMQMKMQLHDNARFNMEEADTVQEKENLGVHMIQATTSLNDVLSHLPEHMKCRARPPMTSSIAVFKRHLASSHIRNTEVPLAYSVRKNNFCNYLKSNHPRVSRKTPIHKISEQRRKIFLTDLTSSNKEKQVADKNEQENKKQTDQILPTKRPLEDDLRNDSNPTKKKHRISDFNQKDLSPHMGDNSNKNNKKFEGNRSHSETLAATDFISALLSSLPANNLNLLSPLENFEPFHSPVHDSEGTANFTDNKENEAPEKIRNISLGSNQFNSFFPKRPLEDDLRNDSNPTKKKLRISDFNQKDLSPHMGDNSNKNNKKFEGNRSHSETLAATDFISALLSSLPANNLNLLSPLENFEPFHTPVHDFEGTANFSDNKENEAPEKIRNISLGSNQFNSFSLVDDGIIKESTCKRSLGISGTSDPCCCPECVLANDCSKESERNRQSLSRGQVKPKTDRHRKRRKNPQQDPTDCERPDTKLYREILRNDTSFIDIVNLKKIKSLEEREIASSYIGRYHQFYAQLCYRIPIHSKKLERQNLKSSSIKDPLKFEEVKLKFYRKLMKHKLDCNIWRILQNRLSFIKLLVRVFDSQFC